MTLPPKFVVLALPRSRTTWLGRFLTYGPWICTHEEVRYFRGVDDIHSWMQLPYVGSVETAVAPFWRLLPEDLRVVIVRRPVGEVVESLVRAGAVGTREGLIRAMERVDAKLSQIARRRPGVLQVDYAALASEAVCAEVFTHCLSLPHNPEWWQLWHRVNLQVNLPALLRYAQAHRVQLSRMAGLAKGEILQALAQRQQRDAEGMDLLEVPLATLLAEAQPLFAEHARAVGEPPDSFAEKNIPLLAALERAGALRILIARSNGRVFGYLMTEVAPSRESRTRVSATETLFYAGLPGLGMRLQRENLRRLRAEGVGEVWFRAGPRGDGPRMGAMFRRVGAVPDGQLYRLSFEQGAL